MSCVSWLEAQLMGRERRGGGGEGEEKGKEGEKRRTKVIQVIQLMYMHTHITRF